MTHAVLARQQRRYDRDGTFIEKVRAAASSWGDEQIEIDPDIFTAICRECSGTIGLGDLVEKAAKPIARTLGLGCLDENGNLRPESGCAQRRDTLNEFSAKFMNAPDYRQRLADRRAQLARREAAQREQLAVFEDRLEGFRAQHKITVGELKALDQVLAEMPASTPAPEPPAPATPSA
jgi:hypothetical protein